MKPSVAENRKKIINLEVITTILSTSEFKGSPAWQCLLLNSLIHTLRLLRTWCFEKGNKVISYKKILAFVSVIANTACVQGQNHKGIDDFLSASAMDENMSGFVAMAADNSGVIYSGAFGRMDVSEDREMTLNTLMQIASMTKPVTSVAALQLVEQGKLELDVPISSYLSELSKLQILDGFDAQGNPILRPTKKQITLRHLLTHTSGFVYEFSNENAFKYRQIDGVGSVFSPGKGFLNVPLAFEPGTKWEYGIGVDWVGVIIEKVSGKSLDDYFKENIFDPLNMKNTGFHLSEEQKGRLATLYSRSDDGSLTPRGRRQNDPFFAGGSGLVSTASDYLTFLQAILNGGEFLGQRILKSETVELMSRNNIGDLFADDVLHSYIPFVSKNINFFENSKSKFGLGFLINTSEIPMARMEGSLTWAGLYNTYFWIDPKGGICGVFMAQLLPFFDEKTIEIFSEFERKIYQLYKIKEK